MNDVHGKQNKNDYEPRSQTNQRVQNQTARGEHDKTDDAREIDPCRLAFGSKARNVFGSAHPGAERAFFRKLMISVGRVNFRFARFLFLPQIGVLPLRPRVLFLHALFNIGKAENRPYHAEDRPKDKLAHRCPQTGRMQIPVAPVVGKQRATEKNGDRREKQRPRCRAKNFIFIEFLHSDLRGKNHGDIIS